MVRVRTISVLLRAGSILPFVLLTGCWGNRARTHLPETSAVATLPDPAAPTMAVVPVSMHDRDAVLVERLGATFSLVWSRKTWGLHLPVIPDSGQPFDAVRAAADEVQRTGQWSQATVERFAENSGCDYVLLLWVKNYGFGWHEMDQTKEIRLGFLLASTQTGQPLIVGQGEAIGAGRRESFDTLEKEAVSKAVEAVIPLLPHADRES